MTLKHLSIATEALITYQGTDFLGRVAGLVEKYRKTPKSKKSDIDFTTALDMAIGQFTGIFCKTEVEYDLNDECYMCSPIIGGNNAISGTNFQPEDSMYENAAPGRGVIRGAIDPVKGRVEGEFGKLEHSMIISHNLLREGKRPEYVASKIIHEVGHGYSFLAYVASFAVRASQLEHCHAALMAEKDPSKYKVIVDRTRQKAGLPPSSVIKREMTNGEEIFHVAAMEMTEDLVKQDPRTVYSYDSAEELADIFATRHGCGRYLADLRLGEDVQQKTTMFSRTRLPALGLVALYFLPTVSLTPAATILLTMYLGLELLINFIAPDQSSAERSIRIIRNEMIASLKEKGLKDKKLIEDIDHAMERLEQSRQAFNKDHLRLIVRSFMPGRSLAKRIADYHDGLSSLANNDLFVAAAKLKSH